MIAAFASGKMLDTTRLAPHELTKFARLAAPTIRAISRQRHRRGLT